jgi:hypothetical protein
MSPNYGALSKPAPTRPDRAGDAALPVLIRVPSLAGSGPHVRLRPARLRPRSEFAGTPTRRRRLRREVRVAGSALLFCVPMAFALVTAWGPRPTSGAATPPVFEPRPVVVASAAELAEPAPVEAARPLATISFEPMPENPRPEVQVVPVVRPAGFLLPDDGPEEPAHAGG